MLARIAISAIFALRLEEEGVRGAELIVPIVFLVILWNSRFHVDPKKRNLYIGITLIVGLWLYLGIAWDADPPVKPDENGDYPIPVPGVFEPYPS
mgnify:CR=1 FL=1